MSRTPAIGSRSPARSARRRDAPRTGATEMRVQLALERTAAALGAPDLRGTGTELGEQLHELLMPAIAALSERIRDPAPADRSRLTELGGLLVELHDQRDELRERRLDRHLSALSAVEEGMSRLRASNTLPELLGRVCAEVCRSCDFDRAILFRVDGSELIAEAAHMSDDPDWAAEVVRVGREHRPQLTHLLLETEMLRRKQPALVEDPQSDPRTFKPIVEVTNTEGYVASPIIPDDRVIGFIHADTYTSQRPLDELDRDVLWAFARGFGHTVERAILRERLDAQRQQVRRMISSTEAVMEEMAAVDIQLAPLRTTQGEAPMARAAAALFVAPETRIEALLTKREREVLALMASGSTNAAIAERLVISHGTVKSHVKHILRKLRAANRAEAVSRYLRLSAMPPGAPDD